MEVLNSKLSKLEQEHKNINDISLVLPELSQKIKGSIYAAGEEANATQSIDERIQVLIDGLQSVVNLLTECEREVATNNFVLKTKIAVVEEIVDELLSAEAQEE